jgi:hypothetical protein
MGRFLAAARSHRVHGQLGQKWGTKHCTRPARPTSLWPMLHDGPMAPTGSAHAHTGTRDGDDGVARGVVALGTWRWQCGYGGGPTGARGQGRRCDSLWCLDDGDRQLQERPRWLWTDDALVSCEGEERKGERRWSMTNEETQ